MKVLLIELSGSLYVTLLDLPCMPIDKSQKLRIAIVGGGSNSAIGNVHRLAMRMLGGVVLVGGMFSRNELINSDSHDWWEGTNSGPYSNMGEMYSRSTEFDAVIVLSPPESHYEAILNFIMLGKKVVTDKPITASLQEARKIFELSRNMERQVLTTYNYSGYPMVRELRERISQGDFGEILSVNISMYQEGFIRQTPKGEVSPPQSWRLKDELIPTVSLDLGTHVLHLLKVIIGTEIANGYSFSQSKGNFRVFDQVDFLGVSTSNFGVRLGWGKTSLGFQNGLKIELFGSKGSASWVQTDPETLQMSDKTGLRYSISRGNHQCIVANDKRYSRFKGGHPSGFIEAFANTYEDILRDDLVPSKYRLMYGLPTSLSIMDTLDKIHTIWQEGGNDVPN